MMKGFLLPAAVLCLTGSAGCGGYTAVPTAAPPAIASADAAESAALPSANPSVQAPLSSGDRLFSATVDGLERSYIVHVPPDFDATRPIPVVLVFHGLSQDGFYMIDSSGFAKMADRGGFLAVFPDGYDPGGQRSWNVGWGCCNHAGARGIDDVAFVRRILSDLRTAAVIDPKRIFAVGFDDGAMFAYRLGCEMSDTFAAVSPVASLMLSYPCEPSDPVSVFHVHGNGDQFIPLEGRAPNPSGGEPFPPLMQGIDTWAGIDGCPPAPRVERDDHSTRTVYEPCRDGTAVELFILNSLGHRWPPDNLWEAAPNIWNFFAGHPKA
jgi:polyhydroxybutyrate depolymerase